jgi:hypothetical protein
MALRGRGSPRDGGRDDGGREPRERRRSPRLSGAGPHYLIALDTAGLPLFLAGWTVSRRARPPQRRRSRSPSAALTGEHFRPRPHLDSPDLVDHAGRTVRRRIELGLVVLFRCKLSQLTFVRLTFSLIPRAVMSIVCTIPGRVDRYLP